MIYWTFLLKSWRAIGAAILLSLIGLQHIRSLNDELEIEGLKSRYQLENVVRESQVQAIKNKSERTIGELNAKIPLLVERAQKNARDNYERRYRDTGGNSLGGGVSGTPALGLRDTPTNPTCPVQAGSAEGAGANAPPVAACDPRFLAEAAEAAAIIKGWNDWATANDLPREK